MDDGKAAMRLHLMMNEHMLGNMCDMAMVYIKNEHLDFALAKLRAPTTRLQRKMAELFNSFRKFCGI